MKSQFAFFQTFFHYKKSLILSNEGKLKLRKKVRPGFCTSSIKREIRHFHVAIVQWWQWNVDKTIRCTCKVVDLLIIKLLTGRPTLPEYVVTCLEWHCIFETELQDIRIFSFFGHPWKCLKAHFSMMSPKFRCQARVRHPSEKVQPTQNTVRERGYFIREIISPSDEIIAHIHCPFFMNVFLHTSLAWGVTARHCTASTSGEFSNIWQSKRVGIIAIKNKRTRIRFQRYSPGGRGILNSLTWGIDWWRKKKLLPVTVLEPSVVFA